MNVHKTCQCQTFFRMPSSPDELILLREYAEILATALSLHLNGSYYDFEQELQESRELAEIWPLERIDGYDALLWILGVGASLPFQWGPMQQFVSTGAVDIDSLETIVSLFNRTNKLSLSDRWQHTYRNVRLSLSLYLRVAQHRAIHRFQKLLAQYLSNKNVRVDSVLGTGLLLTQCGLYAQSIKLLQKYSSQHSIRLQAINCFYAERWDQTKSLCADYRPFLTNSREPDGLWISNLLFGIQIYSMIRLNHRKKAKQLVRAGTKCKLFMNNAIIAFCATELRIKSLQKLDYANDPRRYHYLEIFCLFQGMICQYHLEDYLSAICLYHQCNFYGAHPIHFYRLFECYRVIGLYGKALGCLRMAVKRAKGTVPSIVRDVLEKQAELELRLRNTYCDVCGLRGWDISLFACSHCLSVYYCSTKCQKIGWKLRDHRSQCDKRFQGFKQRLKRAKRSPFLT